EPPDKRFCRNAASRLRDFRGNPPIICAPGGRPCVVWGSGAALQGNQKGKALSEINVRAYLPEQPGQHLYDRPFTSLIVMGTRPAEKELGDLADKWVRNILISRKILPEARR